jgi:type IV secretory pathway VirB10-like protein
MAYADQEVSGNKIVAFVVVALLHLILGYALVTGLAYEGMKQIAKKLTTVEIKKDEKKEEKKPPPPPKKIAPPPIVAPPPRVNIGDRSRAGCAAAAASDRDRPARAGGPAAAAGSAQGRESKGQPQ